MSKNNKIPDRIQAVWNKLGGDKGVDRFLDGEIMVSETFWRVINGVTYFSVTSNGKTAEEWVKMLGNYADEEAVSTLHSDAFSPTSGVTTKLAVLKLADLPSDEILTTARIFEAIETLPNAKPSLEIALLIWEKFTPTYVKEIGMPWMMVMHDPFVIPATPDVDWHLGVKFDSSYPCSRRLVSAFRNPGTGWGGDGGFVFTTPS